MIDELQPNQPECVYTYIAWNDNNWIEFWEYELTTAFENLWNQTKKSAVDWWGSWVELARFEIWLDLVGNNSAAATAWVITSISKWVCNADWTALAYRNTECMRSCVYKLKSYSSFN